MERSLEKQALEELDGKTCYCGAEKKAGQSFCSRCYFSLPKETQRALYRHISEGYAGIYDEAKDWLRINTDRIKGHA